MHKPFRGLVAYEWQIGRLVLQFCHNKRHGRVWRFNWFLA